MTGLRFASLAAVAWKAAASWPAGVQLLVRMAIQDLVDDGRHRALLLLCLQMSGVIPLPVAICTDICVCFAAGVSVVAVPEGRAFSRPICQRQRRAHHGLRGGAAHDGKASINHEIAFGLNRLDN